MGSSTRTSAAWNDALPEYQLTVPMSLCLIMVILYPSFGSRLSLCLAERCQPRDLGHSLPSPEPYTYIYIYMYIYIYIYLFFVLLFILLFICIHLTPSTEVSRIPLSPHPTREAELRRVQRLQSAWGRATCRSSGFCWLVECRACECMVFTWLAGTHVHSHWIEPRQCVLCTV